MHRTWYIFQDNDTRGPVTDRELFALIESGELRPGALIWRPGFAKWRRATDVDGLFTPPPVPDHLKGKNDADEPRERSVPAQPAQDPWPNADQDAGEPEVPAGPQPSAPPEQHHPQGQGSMPAAPPPGAHSTPPWANAPSPSPRHAGIPAKAPHRPKVTVPLDLGGVSRTLDGDAEDGKGERPILRTALERAKHHSFAHWMALAPLIAGGLACVVALIAIGNLRDQYQTLNLLTLSAAERPVAATPSAPQQPKGTAAPEIVRATKSAKSSATTMAPKADLPTKAAAARVETSSQAQFPPRASKLGPETESIRDKARPSLVRIVAYGKQNVPVSVGMGFYFARNLIATNLHLVQGAASFAIEDLQRQRASRAVRVKAVSRQYNVAVLETAQDGKPLPLTEDEPARAGDAVMVFGHPRWSEHEVATGKITTAHAPEHWRTYEMTASVSPGRSGGPAFDKEGRAIGIATFALKDAETINLVMPTGVLKSLARQETPWASKPLPIAKAGIRAAIRFANYSKEAGAQEEYITLQNLTKETVANVLFAVVYKGKKDKVFYVRLLRIKGPIASGLTKMATYKTPKVVWPFAYTRIDGTREKLPFFVEVIPLDFEVSRNPAS